MGHKLPKHTYKFNPHTLRYEKVIVTLRDRVKSISFNMLLGVVIGMLVVVVVLQFVESPKERIMSRELAQYKRQARLLNDRIDRAERVIEDLEDRDDNLYRVIFESEPVNDSIRRSGLGDPSRYDEFNAFSDNGLLKYTSRRVDNLTKRVYVESLSLDSLFDIARNKTERMAAMPAIMPIAKDKCKVVSGFGVRFHPILKSHRLHAGIDMTARQGTPIYATGNGRVVAAGRNIEGYAGYGNVVLIDHGFGFRTLYAHLHSVSVKNGQQVKRGEQIGTVGSSGLSTGSHLHYEVEVNGKKVNPVYYFFHDLTPEEYDDVIEQASEENQCMS